MIQNNFYTQEFHGPYELYDLGDFQLEDGGVIPNCQIAYTTHGKLNEQKDNAILVTTWYSGTTKIMEQIYIGEEHALDPSKYFIILINLIGGGLSSSPHNTPPPNGMTNFPNTRIGDDVRAQHKLVTEKFGIEKLFLVFGASMGGQQIWEWAVRYPDMVLRALPLAINAKNSQHSFIFTDTLNEAIMSDDNWNNGLYSNSSEVQIGLFRQARLWAVMGLNPEFYSQEYWRNLGFNSLDEFISGFLEEYYEPLDPNNLLHMAWKWQRSDVSRNTNGDLEKALGRIKAKMYVIAFTGDMFIPQNSLELEQKMVRNSEFKIVNTICGHFALFALEPEYMKQIDKYIGELLETPVL